jgi:N6-adenosine-specific RNA methylase IME4
MSNGTHIGHRIARVDTLRPHPRNSEIYGDPRDSQDFTFFVQDCQENGIHPLVIAEDGTIIGGHRRYYAALQLGIEELPVAVYRYATPVDMLAALVADNNARIKSNWQLSSEAAVLMEVERERAKQRQAVSAIANSPFTSKVEPVPPSSDTGKARDAVGAQLGVSGKQVDNLLTVKRAVDTLRDAGDDEAADELITLVNRSAKAAAQQARSQMERDARRVERVEKINAISRGNAPLDVATSYPVIYADPPWRYEHSRTDNRQIENHYPTMDLAQICALPVSDVAAADAVLLLWATSPKLAESMQVIEAWGFTYRTCMVWDKEVIGMGYYARQQHELLLIATRGNLPTPEPANRPSSVVRVRRPTKHSEKPTEFYALIESMYPEYARIELFARNAREGWAVWGNQAND